MKDELDRFSSLVIQSTLRLKNRVVVPPMASSTADPAGRVTEKTLAHYRSLCQSGAGLVMVEYSFVHSSGRSEENQLGISDDFHLDGLTRLAEAIHAEGGRAGIQLTHAGGKTSPDLTSGDFMGPSAVPVPVKGTLLKTPREMGEADIQLWKDSFASAISIAVRAGFDLVELHCAHGYGLNQWLSPLTNHRSDAYGGDNLNDRAKLLLEMIQAARHAFPRLALSVRMPGQDFLEGGLGPSEGVELAKLLEAAGVRVLSISSGIGGWRRPSDRTGEGYLVEEAERIRLQVAIPVIGVGGISSGLYIDQILKAGKVSLAAVGRAILGDPQQWAQQWMKPRPAWKT